MGTPDPDDSQVEDDLAALGVEWLCQWDALVFLYRHETSLVSAEHIARLLGYPTGGVVQTPDHLESQGLVERSRVEYGVRLYQFVAPKEPHHDEPFRRLTTLAESRAGRLLLAQKLRRDCPEEAESHSGSRRGERRAVWLKAI